MFVPSWTWVLLRQCTPVASTSAPVGAHLVLTLGFEIVLPVCVLTWSGTIESSILQVFWPFGMKHRLGCVAKRVLGRLTSV